MPPCRSSVVAAAVLASLSATGQAATEPAAAAARASLEQVRQAYAAAGAFTETLRFTLELPDGRREERVQRYGVDGRGGAFFALDSGGREALRVVAGEGRIVAVEVRSAERYVQGPYADDFAAALTGIGGGDVQLTVPAAVVAAQGGDLEAFLDAARMSVLTPPLTAVGSHPATAEDGSPLVEVELTAANGRLVLGIDAATHRQRTLRAALGDGPQQVRAIGTFELAGGDPGGLATWPELAGRAAVASFAALQAADYPLGEVAPELTLHRPDGGTVRLAELRGSVVVLDFWATWCVPCWTALAHTAELAAWAASSGLPVRVFAVDTLESGEDFAALVRQARSLLAAKHLDPPLLIDEGSAAFAAFHNPGLPSLVIIDRQGRLARYHSGLLESMTETVRAEVLALLE